MSRKLKNVPLLEIHEPYQKMLYWFFSYPTAETTLNELAENLSISKTTANTVVHLLEKEGFLTKKVYGRAWSIRCNQQHYYNYSRKIAFNLGMVYAAYLTNLQDKIVSMVGNMQSVILFGSYRKGDDRESSDIDIAVEVESSESVEVIELGKISKFGYRRNVPVNVHIFCRKNVDINLFSNIANGIVLEGFLEV